MSGWTFFFVCIGAAVLTMQLFHLVDLIEQPSRRHRRRAA